MRSTTPDRSAGSKRELSHAEPGEHEQRTEIVWLPEDESALDAFASESDLLEVPAPSPAAATDESWVAFTTYSSSSIPDRSIEPIRAPAIETIREDTIDPIEDYQIDSARNVAFEPVRQDAPLRSLRPPGTSLLRRFAIFVVLALGVFGGGLAGLYLRRNPLDLAIVRIPGDDAANQATIAVQAAETASPIVNGDGGTAQVTEPPAASSGAPPASPGNPAPPTTPPPETGPIPNATATSGTPVPAPPRAAAENLSPPPVGGPPAPAPASRMEPETAARERTSGGERSGGGEVRSAAQAIPLAAGASVDALVVPPAADDAVTPDAGPASTTDRVRVTDATPGIAADGDDQRIAAVLKRFTDAYTQLNAPAAKAVWPSVDGRALSRAFDALESQSIAFDDCTVHFAGAEAHAACVGNVTYVPKIGRRSARTVNRQWNFVMKKNSEGWMIADAQMR